MTSNDFNLALAMLSFFISAALIIFLDFILGVTLPNVFIFIIFALPFFVFVISHKYDFYVKFNSTLEIFFNSRAFKFTFFPVLTIILLIMVYFAFLVSELKRVIPDFIFFIKDLL